MSDHPAIAYKVLTSAELAAFDAVGVFSGSAVDLVDGFIHLSTAEQLTETIAKHFAGQNGLVVLSVNLAALGEAVRWEPSRGGALFPHIYGALAMSAVIDQWQLGYAQNGQVLLP